MSLLQKGPLYYLEEFKNFFSKPKKDKSKSSQNEIKQKEEKKKEESKTKPIDTDYEEPPNFKYITIRLKPINEYYFRNKRDARNAAKRAGKGKEPLEQKAHDDGFDYFVNYESTSYKLNVDDFLDRYYFPTKDRPYPKHFYK